MRLFTLLKVVLRQAINLQPNQKPPVMGKPKPTLILSFEQLCKAVILLLEHVTRFKSFRDQVVSLLRSEVECLNFFSSFQYTLTSDTLALRFTKFIKKHFHQVVLDSVDEALFEFNFDMVSASSIGPLSVRSDP